MIKFFKRYRKRFESNDKDFKYFNQKILLKLSELYGYDPGSQKTHRGYRSRDQKAPDPGSATLDMGRGSHESTVPGVPRKSSCMRLQSLYLLAVDTVLDD
jgi:hypothetical protein